MAMDPDDNFSRARYLRAQLDATESWKAAIRKRCPECRIDSNGKVEVNDAFWFKIGSDPWVLEATAQPMTLEGLERNRAPIQNAVWDAASDAGLMPHWRIGNGHLHLDIASHFGEDAVLFRNFVADLANRPELFMGALSMDFLNAPPLAVLMSEQRRAFARLLERFDRGGMSIQQFKTAMNELVYDGTFNKRYLHPKSYPAKYQALNLRHDHTVEVRGLKPQASMDEHLKIVRLFESRIESLKKEKGPIPYVPKDYSQAVQERSVRAMEFYSTSLDPQKVRDEFRRFVEAAGLNWSDYEPLMTEELKLQLKMPVSNALCSDLYGFVNSLK